MTKEIALQELNTAYSIQDIAKKASLDTTYMCVYVKDLQSNEIKAFYIKNDDFNLLSDDEIKQTTFYKTLISNFLNSNAQINTKISTLGFKTKAGTFDNKDENYLIHQISSQVQTTNDVLFWLNNRTHDSLPSDHEIQTTAMKHYVLMEKIYTLLREDCPHITSNYQISGHSLGTHSLTYFLDFLNNDNKKPGHLFDSSSKIEINLQSIPTFSKLGINFIKRPKEMAQKMFEVLSNEKILKYIRNGQISFKFDVSDSTYHTPKGTLEYLHELFDLIPRSNLTDSDKAHLIYSLQQSTINFKKNSYQRLRKWAQDNGRLDEEHKFLQNFNTPGLDEMRRQAEKQDEQKLQNTTYAPEIACGFLGASVATGGTLGLTNVINMNKTLSIILVSVGALGLFTALVCCIKKRKTINHIQLSLPTQHVPTPNRQ